MVSAPNQEGGFEWAVSSELPDEFVLLIISIIAQKFSNSNRKLPKIGLNLPVFRNSNVSNLLPVALALRELGCAVIPLLGGDDRHAGKRPALRWSTYQTRLPYPDELSAWFGDGRFSAYGVVCGSVSRLVVLDLDKPSLADAFAKQFPHLMETLVVKSGLRGTPHIYWRTDFRVESRAFPGGDLKAEGGYVVGPGSMIAGATWSIASDKPIRSISHAELSDVLAFLVPIVPAANLCVGIPTSSKNRVTNTSVPDLPVDDSRAITPVIVTAADLIAYYNRRVDSGSGRNKALFDTARLARDSGYSESDTLEMLSQAHAAAKPPTGHPRESEKARLAEAARTIQSVYTHPAHSGSVNVSSGDATSASDQTHLYMPFDSSIVGASTGESTSASDQTHLHTPFDSSIHGIHAARFLPNTARERLLARPDGAAILRTFEGALLSGISETALVTEPELCRRLAHIISRKTIRKALGATYDDSQPIFFQAGFQLDVPQTPQTPVDTDVEKLYRQKNALLSLGQDGTKVAHRPPRYFVMPTIKAICAGLGVKMTVSSPVTMTDLSSSRGYRQALHADLLTRRPGVYSQIMLGARLGVTARTIRRYHRQMPIQSSKTYDETPISSHNLHRIPSGADISRMMLNVGGQFLMDSAGEKWPLKREIAAWLLKRGRRVSHMEQKCSYYWVEPAVNASVEAGLRPAPTTAAIPVGAQYIAPNRSMSRDLSVGIPTHTPTMSAHAQTSTFPIRAQHAAPLQLQPSPAQPVSFTVPGYTHVNIAGESLLVKTHPSLLPQQMPLFAQEGALAPRITPKIGVTRQNAGILAKSPIPRESKRKYRQPLADERAERLANRLWATIKDFSVPNARRLVTTYGIEPVEAALKKMLFLQANGKINNPGGFIVTASRISWRVQNRKSGLGDSAPRFRAEPR